MVQAPVRTREGKIQTEQSTIKTFYNTCMIGVNQNKVINSIRFPTGPKQKPDNQTR